MSSGKVLSLMEMLSLRESDYNDIRLYAAKNEEHAPKQKQPPQNDDGEGANLISERVNSVKEGVREMFMPVDRGQDHGNSCSARKQQQQQQHDRSRGNLLKGYSLLPHQKTIVRQMKIREQKPDAESGVWGGIVFVEMGLGKTLVTLATCDADADPASVTLVVVNKGLLTNWVSERDKFYGGGAGTGVPIMVAHKSQMSRKLGWTPQSWKLSARPEVKVVLTTYEALVMAFKNKSKYHRDAHELQVASAAPPSPARDQRVKELRRKLQGYQYSLCSLVYGEINSAPRVWHRVVCDESQNFCNASTAKFAAVCDVPAERRWCLTGTPIANCARDVRAQLVFAGLRPELAMRSKDWDTPDVYKDHGLHRHVIQMTYETANVRLPPKHYSVVRVRPTRAELCWYKAQTELLDSNVQSFQAGDAGYSKIMSALLRMRQSAVAPALSFCREGPLKRGEKEEEQEEERCGEKRSGRGERTGRRGGAGGATENSKVMQKQTLFNMSLQADFLNCFAGKTKYAQAVKMGFRGSRSDFAERNALQWLSARLGPAGVGSSKMRSCVSIVQRVIPRTDKVVVFSAFTQALTLFQQALNQSRADFEWLQLDGRLSTEQRDAVKNKFVSCKNTKVLLIHYSVGCEGLTLVEANHMIMLDPWWSHAVQRQAEARIHRIGQRRPVVIWIPYMQGTVEAKVHSHIEKKRQLSDEMLVNSCLEDGEDRATPKGADVVKQQGFLGDLSIKDILEHVRSSELSDSEDCRLCGLCLGQLYREQRDYAVYELHSGGGQQSLCHVLCGDICPFTRRVDTNSELHKKN